MKTEINRKNPSKKNKKNTLLLSSTLFLLGGCCFSQPAPQPASQPPRTVAPTPAPKPVPVTRPNTISVSTNLGTGKVEPNTAYDVTYVVNGVGITNNKVVLTDFEDLDYQQAEIGTPRITNGTITGGNIKTGLNVTVNSYGSATIIVPVKFNATYQANDATVDNLATLKTLKNPSNALGEYLMSGRSSVPNATNFLNVSSMKSKQVNVKGFTSKVASVQVYDSKGVLLGTTLANANGNFNVQIREGITGESLTVKSIKNGVTISKVVVVGTIDKPVVDPLFESSNFTLTGKGSPNSLVRAFDSNNNVVSVAGVTATNGRWNSALMKRAVNGDAYFVKQSDPKTGELSDASYVVVGATNTPALNTIKVGNVVTGSGVKNARITIKDRNNNVIGETTVDQNGNYSVTVSRALNELETISAYQSDDTGVSQPATATIAAVEINETITAQDISVTSDKVSTLTNAEILQLANATAKDNVTNQSIEITSIKRDNLVANKGLYTIELSTAKNTKKLINVLVGYDSEVKVDSITNESLVGDDFSVTTRGAQTLTPAKVIETSLATAWNNDSKAKVDFVSVDLSQVKGTKGVYPITLTTAKGSTLTTKVLVGYLSDTVVGNNSEIIKSDDFILPVEEVATITNENLISKANIYAWNKNNRQNVAITVADKSSLKSEKGVYPVTFKTANNKFINVNVAVGYKGPIYYDSSSKKSFVGEDIVLTSAEVRTLTNEQVMALAKPVTWNINDKIVSTNFSIDKSKVVDKAGKYNIDFYYQDAPSKKFSTLVYVDQDYIPGFRRDFQEYENYIIVN